MNLVTSRLPEVQQKENLNDVEKKSSGGADYVTRKMLPEIF